jgi:hypothetical protein
MRRAWLAAQNQAGEALIESFQATLAGDYFNTGTLSTSNST